MADALGNPMACHLTAGQATDLNGADFFLPGLEAKALLADRSFDVDGQVIEPLRAAGIEPVIPSTPEHAEDVCLVRLRREAQPALPHAVWKIAAGLDLEAIFNKSLTKAA